MMGNYSEAKSYFESATAINPTHVPSLQRLVSSINFPFQRRTFISSALGNMLASRQRERGTVHDSNATNLCSLNRSMKRIAIFIVILLRSRVRDVPCPPSLIPLISRNRNTAAKAEQVCGVSTRLFLVRGWCITSRETGSSPRRCCGKPSISTPRITCPGKCEGIRST